MSVEEPTAHQPMGRISVAELFNLRGRTALVTGGTGRYGRPISEALAEAGARVLVASREMEKARGVTDELKSADLECYPVVLDLSSGRAITHAWESIKGSWGHVDILFNNAVERSGARFETMTEDDWDKTLSVNAKGLFTLSRLAGQEMAERRSGSIVNVASIHGVVAPDFRIYGATGLTSPANYAFEKGGMLQLTRYLASKFAPHNVRVNSLSPGGLHSDSLPEEFLTNYCARTPLRRMANASDIKGAALFLASDASAYVTGHNLVVDGGYTAI